MSVQPAQFPYVEMDPALGSASRHPYLPITLANQQQTVTAIGLADSGGTINVLPHDVGLRLGFVWQLQTTSVRLTGNLAGVEARVITLNATVAPFSPVLLAFAWAKVEKVPIILGQVNFFMEFDVCFFRSRSVFEVKPK